MRRREHLYEDMTASEVRSIVNNKIDDLLKDKEFEKRVNELTAKVMEKFITNLFNKRLMWMSTLKN